VADTVGVGQETEKCDDPENRPEKYAFMKLWEPQLHLNMAFVEPGMDTGVLVGTAADNFSLCITAEIAVCENFFQKNGTVRGRAVNLRINGGRKTEINTAGLFWLPHRRGCLASQEIQRMLLPKWASGGW